MNTSRLAPASNQSGGLTSSQRLLWRLLGGLALAGLIGWLLLLNLGDGNETQPYRSFTPQEAASQCAVETGITANDPGQPMTNAQLNLLTACMDREIARAGLAR